VDDRVIAGTTDINVAPAIVAFDALDGHEHWRAELEERGALLSPVVAGGRIYAFSWSLEGAGGLIAFGDRA
jgi:hypothetical protein